MALQSDDNEGASRNSGIAASNADYTTLFWYKPRTGSSGGRVLFLLVNGVATYTQWIAIYALSGAPNSIFLDIGDGGVSVAQSSAFAITVDKPVPIAYVRSGNDHRLYIEGLLVATITHDVSAFSLTELTISNDTGPTRANEMQGFKEWDTALTLAELIVEWNLLAATKTSNLWSEIPLSSDLNDISGNARHLSAIGAPTFVTSATQVPLTNTSGAASVDITLGEEYIQVNNNGSGASVGLGYKYTGAAGELVFGIWGVGDPDYLPVFNVYEDSAWTIIYNSISNYPRRPIEIPILVDQDTLYIRIVQNSGNPVGSLYLKTQSFTQQAAPAGSILINDAGSGPSVALLDGSNGDPLQLRNGFVPGEIASILQDELRMIHQDINNPGDFVIHNTQLIPIATVVATNPGQFERATGNRDDRFYLISNTSPAGIGDTDLQIFDKDGTLIDTQTLASTAATSLGLAVDNVNDIMYYAAATAGAPIKRWSVSSQAFLSDLVAGIANYIPVAILWMNGDTILVAYNHNTTASLSQVLHYSSAGATLATFNTQFSDRIGADFHIAYDFPNVNPDTHFWAWIKIANGLSRFMRIRLSDGVIVTTFDRVHFTNGSADDDAENFGHSESCNFVLTPEPLPTPPTSLGTLIVTKITDPVDTTFDFVIAVQGGLSPAQITLNHGDSQVYTDVTPGTYAVIEEPQTLWVTTYVVSNGSPNTAVTVAAGETVTVTITNTRKGSIKVQKSIIPAGSGVLFTFTATGLTPVSFQLAGDDEIIFDDLDPGSGYAISETLLPTGWTLISVTTSNGSPITAILVEPGVETLVVFTNQFVAAEASGIYKIEPDKTDDTLWVDLTPPGVTFRRKIPDPTIKTSFVGD